MASMVFLSVALVSFLREVRIASRYLRVTREVLEAGKAAR
jgi:hypothetical protein